MNLKVIFSAMMVFLFLNLSAKLVEPVDTAIVNIKSKDTTDFPVSLIVYQNGASQFLKGVQLQKGSYQFRIPVQGYGKADVFIQSPFSILMAGGGFMPQPRPSILIGGGKVTNVVADFKNQLDLKVESTDPEIMLFESFGQVERSSNEESWSLIKERSKEGVSEDKKKEIETALAALSQKLTEKKKAFTNEHLESFAALEVFDTYYQQLETSTAFADLQKLALPYKESFLWTSLFKKLTAASQTDAGTKIPAFSGTTVQGAPFNSSNLQGKYYLVDFWGSWCGPCRKSHPKLKELYKKYKPKGFEIVGIAFESGSKQAQTKAWKAAIKMDGLNWVNLLNTEDNDLVKQFGVTSYPTKLLINPKGEIVLRVGEESEKIENYLADVLK